MQVQEFNQAVQYRPDDLPGWGMGGLVLIFFFLAVAVSYLGKTIYALRHPATA
jgi:hypothetical protein